MWELRKAEDGQVFGPVDVESLKRWAANGQISPLDTLTDVETRKTFAPFELSDLEMIWEVTLDDGAVYGPAHANAIRVFVRDGQILPKDTVRDINRGEKFMAGEFELYLEKQYPMQRREPLPAVHMSATSTPNKPQIDPAGSVKKEETRLKPLPPASGRRATHQTTMRPVDPPEVNSPNDLQAKIRQLETAIKLERINYEKLKQHYQDLNQRYIELKDRVRSMRLDPDD